MYRGVLIPGPKDFEKSDEGDRGSGKILESEEKYKMKKTGLEVIGRGMGVPHG